MHLKTVGTSLLVCLLSCSLYAQDFSSPISLNDQINSVENSLAGWVQVKNQHRFWTLESRMNHYKTPAVSIAVIKDSELVWVKTYGWADKASGTKATNTTVFQAGSISKPIHALAVLQLAHEKKLDLHTNINQYLKDWKFPDDPNTNHPPITLAHLLSHTAGLSVHGFPGYRPRAKLPTLTEVLEGKSPANTEAVKSLRAPGTKFEYSGGGTVLSQLVLQDITALPYDQFMLDYILHPLQMEHSSYQQPPPLHPPFPLATGYQQGEAIEGNYHVYPEQAAAGLWTTAGDLAAYVIELQHALAGKPTKLISKETALLKLTPYRNETVGMGDFIMNKDGYAYFTHGGVNRGFVSQYVGSFQDGYGVVVMANGDSFELITEIINGVALRYNWPNFYEPVIKTLASVPDSVTKKYVGTYQTEDRTIKIIETAGGLHIQFNDEDPVKLYFTSITDFFIYENQSPFKFIVDTNEQITGLTIRDSFLEKIDEPDLTK